DPLRIIHTQPLEVFTTDTMFLLQNRQQLLVVQALGIVEMDRHLLAEGFVAVRDGIKEVSGRNDIADAKCVALLDKKLNHHLQRSSLALEDTRYGNQRLNQSGAERIHPSKHF